MVGGWIASDVFIFIFWSRCCCCYRGLLLLLPTTSVLKRRENLARSEGLARVRVRPRRGRCAALARWQGRVSAVSHTRPNHSALKLLFCDFSAARPRFVARLAHSDSPQSRGPCPRADPPSPRPARSASELARSRHRSPTCAVRLRTNPGTNILLFVTAVGPPAVLASLKPLNNIIQLRTMYC